MSNKTKEQRMSIKINVYLHAPNHAPALLDVSERDLEGTLADLRQHWNEEPTGSQLFWLTDEAGNFLASIHRHSKDNVRAITMYADGRTEQHICEYLFNENGHYQDTEIRPYTETRWGENGGS